MYMPPHKLGPDEVQLEKKKNRKKEDAYYPS
jgi:hypothetical protein